ncbi:hypothetical protein HANVADRAFT_54065 [Hanseniaspora valbyensis NRRL Y-1626]|uniref:Uncharacterized protein n=1 Tax=Hanseniaspora valbyensis NRRL Y-1626 TaxID=766949 RepID=A0A1B7T903_9ASCO|nr:hypothetical protein HANVADRAFT_54065 [Hanseniaspora valbyensis NRRL Y-1626]
MGRPLSIQELLLLKSKAKDIQLINTNSNHNKNIKQKLQLSNSNNNTSNKDVSMNKDEDIIDDLDLLIENTNTSKRFDKLSKIPKKVNKVKQNSSQTTSSFSQVLAEKNVKEMTTSDWEIYAKLNKVDINTVATNKNLKPVRTFKDLDINIPHYLTFDSLAQYSINNLIYLNQNSNQLKPFLAVDNASMKHYSILCYMIPIIYALLNDKDIKSKNNSAKLAPMAIIVTVEDKINELQQKVSDLENEFNNINLHNNVHITTLQKLNTAIDKNQINYHQNLKFFIVDFLQINELNKIDDILVKIKTKILIKAFFIRKNYQILERQDDEFVDKLDQLIDNILDKNDKQEVYKTKTFTNMNILKLR